MVAVAANGVIGNGNALPWRLPADLRHFRRLTTGHAVIMGRKTWDSIGRPLPDRQNLVVTRNHAFAAPGAEALPSLEAAMAAVRLPPPVFCIGGADLFRDALPHAARLHVTEIDAAVDGDILFPAYDRSAWRESGRESHPPGEAPFAYAFVTYDRVR
ncbi:MAG: dihydrofolate reductase [Casimicrobiaceae bacterium]